ncbi:MAG: imidazole glycerol phosphate synthase cyclase subunit, partial [Candidatus Levybacteria bacterium RIFCSPHIGHO2_01_FULL_36_15]
GLRTIEDIKNVLRAGADKVSLNTAAIKNPSIVREASRIFGSSTITVSIEAIKQPNGEYFAYTDNGREYTGIDVLSWAKKVEALGAGEILLTSIDREGTGNGYDIDLLKMITSSVSIPIIACGGAGNLDHILQVIKDGKADAVCVASVLHYELIEKIKTTNNFKEEGNTEFLSSGRNFSKVELLNIDKIKKYLFQNHISCRYKNKN